MAGWTPELRLSETDARCRLWLGGYAYGDGTSLQEAADDLIVRLLSHAMIWRTAQPTAVSCEVTPDLRWLEFTYELAEIAAAGGDIRTRVFGHSAA